MKSFQIKILSLKFHIDIFLDFFHTGMNCDLLTAFKACSLIRCLDLELCLQRIIESVSMSKPSDFTSSVTMGVSSFLDITFFQITYYLNNPLRFPNFLVISYIYIAEKTFC